MSHKMDLSSLTVILVFAREVFSLEAIENLGDGFGRLGKHRLQWYTRLESAILAQLENAMLKHCWDDHFVAWELTIDAC